MAEEEAFENLDSLDWSDVESELKANRDQILSEVKAESSGQKEKKEDDEGSKERLATLDGELEELQKSSNAYLSGKVKEEISEEVI